MVNPFFYGKRGKWRRIARVCHFPRSVLYFFRAGQLFQRFRPAVDEIGGGHGGPAGGVLLALVVDFHDVHVVVRTEGLGEQGQDLLQDGNAYRLYDYFFASWLKR